ncbi:MAG: hypothetical protein PHW79_06230 [Candidatus Marinimicrobia bacterium]|nr:hypothetical protein [Candidatus Neomarinimicrobiota bacterium]
MNRLIITALICAPVILPAQTIDNNQSAPGIDWKIIQTAHYRIIFPSEISTDAERVANNLEYLYPAIGKTLKTKPEKWPIVLNSRNAVTNGYVTLIPKKSEWYATPGHDNEMSLPLDFYDVLAIHEGRHMVQTDKNNRGFNRIMYIFNGNIALLGMQYYSVPMWFFEGDAVGTETALTESGRGRTPSFGMEIRANLLSGISTPYHKAYMRSYQDYFPNHYRLGYYMTTYVRRNFGGDAWNRVLEMTAKRSYNPFAFSQSLKKVTGKKSVAIYDATMNDLTSLWQKQSAGAPITEATILTDTKPDVWTNYKYPAYREDASILALKSGLADPATIVAVFADGREEKICQTEAVGRISYGKNLITWSEESPNIRWANDVHSDVFIYDLSKRQYKSITTNGHFFSPAISPDDSQIATVEFDSIRKCALVLLDAQTGQILQRFPNSDNYFFRNPSFSPDSKQIVFTRQQFQGVALSVLSLETGEVTDILPESFENIQHPVFYGRYILYESPYSGIDNLYAVDTVSHERFQVTSRKFGTFYPCVSSDGKRILFSDYNVSGHSLAEMPLDSLNWKPLSAVFRNLVNYSEPMIAQEQGIGFFNEEKLLKNRYEIRDYRPLSHLLNVHSWYFYPSSVNSTFGVISNDLLNTTAVSALMTYNANEKSGGYEAYISYAGLYSIIDAGLRYDNRVSTATTFSETEEDYWTERGYSIGFRIPLDLSVDYHNKSLEVSTSLSYLSVNRREDTQSEFDGKVIPVSFQANYTWYDTPAPRDIYPPHAFSVSLSTSHTLPNSDSRASIGSTTATLRFPGFAKHHSFGITGTTEFQSADDYRFASAVQFPRGYEVVDCNRLYDGALTYSLPLFYPDFALGSLFYLKRIRATSFIDIGRGELGAIQKNYTSAGFELWNDCHFLDLLAVPVSLGARFSYRLDEKNWLINFIFGI